MEENFSMEWNMEENFSMEWIMEWKIFGMEWKKIARMEYGKMSSIPFRTMPALSEQKVIVEMFVLTRVC